MNGFACRRVQAGWATHAWLCASICMEVAGRVSAQHSLAATFLSRAAYCPAFLFNALFLSVPEHSTASLPMQHGMQKGA